MKHYYFLFLLMLSSSSFGQTKKERSDYRLILSPGLSFQGQVFGELNLMYAKMENGGPCNPPVIYGLRLGVETNFNKDHFVYAPKIGYELNGLISFRGNIITYIDNGHTDLRILPEIGIGFIYFSLNYGYSIPILDFRTPDISRSRISLTFNLYHVFGEKD
jgi:hypothetical protein